MRELLTAARERFGPDAARYKTRQELLLALGLADGGEPGDAPVLPPATAPQAAPEAPGQVELVVKDFFLPPR
ncbi:MAG: hypothetical protein JNJ54_26140 [Myxococcaceae bacterium]|nr:hypothetical protein [Myxococcaceae bacterium]